MLLQVEVNLLTGETTILQTDIIYDCGMSLNPAVDLGQVCLVLTHVLLKNSLTHTHTH
jgi:xanthine dehydrogenase molybdopterin-binding subunit B